MDAFKRFFCVNGAHPWDLNFGEQNDISFDVPCLLTILRMEYSHIIKDILKNPPFYINKTCPSYVKRLLPDLDDRAFVIFHKIVSVFYCCLIFSQNLLEIFNSESRRTCTSY